MAGEKTAGNEVGKDSSMTKSVNIAERQWPVLTQIAGKRPYGIIAMLH